MAITIPHYVGGRRLIGSAERSGAVFNPATGETSGRVAFASPEEVRAAVETAAAAASGWPQLHLCAGPAFSTAFCASSKSGPTSLLQSLPPGAARFCRMPKAKFSAAWRWWSSQPPRRIF